MSVCVRESKQGRIGMYEGVCVCERQKGVGRDSLGFSIEMSA